MIPKGLLFRPPCLFRYYYTILLRTDPSSQGAATSRPEPGCTGFGAARSRGSRQKGKALSPGQSFHAFQRRRMRRGEARRIAGRCSTQVIGGGGRGAAAVPAGRPRAQCAPQGCSNLRSAGDPLGGSGDYEHETHFPESVDNVVRPRRHCRNGTPAARRGGPPDGCFPQAEGHCCRSPSGRSGVFCRRDHGSLC